MSNLSRRGLLVGATAAAALPAWAEGAPAELVKGPLVWMNMDQKELDDSYDQAVYAPNRDIVIKRCIRNSELVRERIGPPKRFTYGPTPFEGLDVFTAKTPNAPIMIYVHGGSWRVGTASQYHYPAEMFLNAGRTMWCRTSPMSATSAAACSPWRIRSAARWPGSITTPRASAATRSASMCPANRPAAIGSAC